MHGIDKYERAVMELLTEYAKTGLSEQMLWRTIYRDRGHPKELTFKAFETLQSKDYILRNGKRRWFRINPESELKIYPEEYEQTLSNLKAINLIINTYKEAYYPSITFDEYYEHHLKKRVTRNITKKILSLAKRDGYIDELPNSEEIQASPNKRTKIEGGRFVKLNFPIWIKKLLFHLYDKWIINLVIGIILAVFAYYLATGRITF